MKHAYLLMVHKLNYTFQTLLSLLDDEQNDIFVNVDKKITDFDASMWTEKIRKSKLFFLKNRVEVTWGGYSMISAEMALLKEATSNGPYAYYHLLSGEDLPIKTQYDIHFFSKTITGKSLCYSQMKYLSSLNV